MFVNFSGFRMLVNGKAVLNYAGIELWSGRLSMAKRGKSSIMESVPLLILLGLLAGAVGGLGIGMIQLKAASSSASAPR